MGEEKTITIKGKTINYGDLSDEKLIKLYKEFIYDFCIFLIPPH